MRKMRTALRGAAMAEYIILICAITVTSSISIALFGDDLAQAYHHYAKSIEQEDGPETGPTLSSDQPGPGTMVPIDPTAPGTTDPDDLGGTETSPDPASPEEGDLILVERPGCRAGPVLPRPPNYVDGDIVLLEFAGNQIGTYETIWGHGNNQERLVYVNGVTPLGSAEEIFTLRIWQTFGNTQVKNGMLADVLDPRKELIAGYFNLKPDEEQRLATGDEHMVMTPIRMVIDLKGLEAGDTVYSYADEIGDPDWGDNDGEFDFDQTGCSQSSQK